MSLRNRALLAIIISVIIYGVASAMRSMDISVAYIIVAEVFVGILIYVLLRATNVLPKRE